FTDMDNDNDYDLFTGSSTVIEFRRNIGSVTNPVFNLEIDTVKCLFVDSGDSIIVPIITDFGCNNILVDIDNDGDKDLFLGNSVGTIYYYENIGTTTNFSFEFKTDRWADILIIGGGAKLERHGSSSLDFADIDDDNDYDLFWGDFFGRSLYYIQNNGTAVTAVMDTPYTYDIYPQNEDSIWTSGFNMPRLADIDGDNDLDLFVTVLYDNTVPQNLMFYRNNGSSSNPVFNLDNDNFLKTLDMGTNSSPVFVDIDNDGDYDMFSGSARLPNGSLFYFENTGTAANPSFNLVDTSFFGIEGNLTITPSFGDLDNDGDFDLIIGEFLGRFSYYRNDGTPSSPYFVFVEQLKDNDGNFITAGNIARPFLIDIDNDNDLDLITGGFNGQIRSYRNIGTPENFLFVRDTSFINFLDVGDLSSPFLIDYDNDGDLDLFSGGSDKIFYYRNDGNNDSPQWTLVTDKFLNQTFGGYVYPSFVDINNDTDYDLFIGNIKGGIYYFRNNKVTSVINESELPQNFSLESYPNPFNSGTNIIVNIDNTEEVTLTVYDILGEKVRQIHNGLLNKGRNVFYWDSKDDKNHDISSGIYFVVAKTLYNFKTIKLILLK
ncbi:MAG TPA: T9SS type A sorting domain-containing protein, partial [Mariniphaga sp.]|nr:T9SS type A sorting domain-containing protein [Mariniphaga sp.]